MEIVNGDMNINIMQAAAECIEIEKFIFISQASVAIQPSWTPFTGLTVTGMFHGKKKAESELIKLFPENGYILSPGIMYGWRQVSKNIALPLQIIFAPIEMLSRLTSALSSVVPKAIKCSAIANEYRSILSVESLAKAIIVCFKGEVGKKVLEADDIRDLGSKY